MDYGRIDPRQALNIDYKLPDDGMFTKLTLNGARADNPSFYVGMPKWGMKAWIGMIYPIKTKEAYCLDEYVKQFNSVECNAVFYSIPPADLIVKWKEKADNYALPNFLFFPKMSRTITHIKRLEGAEAATNEYLESIRNFGKYLGPIFIQIGDNMGPRHIELIKAYLYSLPKDLKFFVEIRHPEWFENTSELFQAMRSFNIGSIITDTAGRRDGVHMELTTPEAFIRFVGNGPSYKEIDFQRIDAWTERLDSWLEKGLEKVYFFVHHHGNSNYDIDSDSYYLELADYSIKQFNARLGANIPELKFL